MWRSIWASPPVDTKEVEDTRQEQQLQDFEVAKDGLLLVLNDDLPGAEALLKKGASTFHLMGQGVTLFIKGLLSFETSVLREAARTLYDGGISATEDYKRSVKRTSTQSKRIYPAGSEYQICFDATQVLRAILGVMDANISESLRGFYNLRKAYATFSSLAAIEPPRTGQDMGSSMTVTPEDSIAALSIRTRTPQHSSRTSVDDGEDKFLDAEEGSKTNTPSTMSPETGEYEPLSESRTRLPAEQMSTSRSSNSQKTATISTEVESMNSIDKFVYTGSRVGFGALLLGISLIPAVFATLLSIVGFKGDRVRGLQLLWAGAEASDGYGSIGALILFEYYNAIVSLCEIYTDELYPRSRVLQLLKDMRQRFPDGRLWMVYESISAALDRDLDRAAELVSKKYASPLKQMESLQMYCYGVYCMHMHRYEECRQSFEDCISMNERSHALSYFVAGTATVALYRQNAGSEAAAEYAEKAERLFDLALKSAGQKRFLAKRIPFEMFIGRKVLKWKNRAEARGVKLIDAVGISPIDELIYFWNGFKRLPTKHLEQSWANLEQEVHPCCEDELDEQTIRTFLQAVVLRNLEKREEAKEKFRQIIALDASSFRGDQKDNWMCPLAHLELAISLWQERDGTSNDTEKLSKCSELIEKASKWEEYDMQGAFSIPLDMASESIKQIRAAK